jgi:hypothetical protein
MKYALLMISNYADFQTLTPEQAETFDKRINAFNDELRRTNAFVSAEGLDEPARTVRFSDGAPRSDEGPFAQGPEKLAGYWIVDAPDLDAAVEWARKAPLSSGAIEVRPLV